MDMKKKLYEKQYEKNVESIKKKSGMPWWLWMVIGMVIGSVLTTGKTVYVKDDSANRRIDAMQLEAAQEQRRQEDRLRENGYKYYSDGTWRK